LYQNPYYQQPRRRGNPWLWIVLAVTIGIILACLCVGGIGAVLYFRPTSPPMPDLDLWPTPTPAVVVKSQTPTPTPMTLPESSTPTPTPAAMSEPSTPTPTPPPPPPADQVEPFVPDLSGVVSAAFSFSRVSGSHQVTGQGQLLWPERSVYEVGDALYLATEGELLMWGDEQDDWVQVLPSARLHDNLVYWLRLLPFATPTSANLEDDGTVFVWFEIDVPQDQNVFGVRDLRGSGWFSWDPSSETLVAVAYDLIYLDRLGTSNNDMLYMEFESWGEPVVVPER
jgi:hypothetical protein